MTAGPGVRVSAVLHVGGGARVRVLPFAECDRVAVSLDYGDASLHLDRDGIALLSAALRRAEVELDAAEDEMAAAIEAEQGGMRAERISA